MQEISLLRLIPKEHPNIVSFHKALQTSSNFYIFLEHCDVGDLGDFIRERHLLRGGSTNKKCMSEKEASYITRDLVRGLAHLSTCKIMHRDIKLDNILVKRKKAASISDSYRTKCSLPIECYEFKLGDLGLAKKIHYKDG